MATRQTRRRRASATRAPVAVGADERRRLIEDCAFFHADRFREADPGAVRGQDFAAAAAEIDAVIRAGKKGGRKR